MVTSLADLTITSEAHRLLPLCKQGFDLNCEIELFLEAYF